MRWSRLRVSYIVMGALICAGIFTASASAATGDILRTIEAGGGPCRLNVGLAVVPNASGELEGAISCYDNSRIDFFKLSDGSLVRTINVQNGSNLGALAYDATRGKIWGCNASGEAILIDPATGSSTDQFATQGCFDGLAFDGIDDTLFASGDGSCTVTHYSTAGATLASHNVCSVPGWSGNGNSGIAVGGSDLYMANDGSSQIYQVTKDFSSATLFHQGDRRIEDIECDNTTFRSQGHGAIWFIDAYDRQVQALEIPADLCGSGGLPPVKSPPGAAPASQSASGARACNRRAISLVSADVRGKEVLLKGLVGPALAGKDVSLYEDSTRGSKTSRFTKVKTVKASTNGTFTARVPKPAGRNLVKTRYRAISQGAKSPTLKLPQSLRSTAIEAKGGTMTVRGHVKRKLLGRGNRVTIQRLVCGHYRTVGSAKPSSTGRYEVTFPTPRLGGVAYFRARARVLRKARSHVYVVQYARAITIRLAAETG